MPEIPDQPPPWIAKHRKAEEVDRSEYCMHDGEDWPCNIVAAYQVGIQDRESAYRAGREDERAEDRKRDDDEVPEGIFAAAGLAMVPWSDVEDVSLFEWHHCIDQPNCPGAAGPCACSGMPWPSRPIQAAVSAAVQLIAARYERALREQRRNFEAVCEEERRAGREDAAEAVWTKACELRKSFRTGGIEYLNGMEDATEIARGEDQDTPEGREDQNRNEEKP